MEYFHMDLVCSEEEYEALKNSDAYIYYGESFAKPVVKMIELEEPTEFYRERAKLFLSFKNEKFYQKSEKEQKLWCNIARVERRLGKTDTLTTLKASGYRLEENRYNGKVMLHWYGRLE